MVREREVSRGKRTIRKLLGRMGKKNLRFHRSAAEENVQRLRALEGLCGNCQNVKVRIFNRDGKRLADVACEADHYPLELYYNSPFGEVPDCPDFTPRR